MDPEDSKVTFICRNYATSYQPGKLKLAIPFEVDFGNTLPEKVYLHVPNTAIWTGKVTKDSMYIENLEEMMVYHEIQPYHFVLFEYRGGPNFKIEIFNPYGVEINYKVDPKPSFVYVNDLVFSSQEVSKLSATFHYNMVDNFSSLNDFVIDGYHLMGESYTKVLSKEASSRLNLSDSFESIDLVLGKYMWTIKLKWVNGEVLFDEGWNTFVNDNRFISGDVVVLPKTKRLNKFRVVLFPKQMLPEKDNGLGAGRCTISPKFIKVINKTAFEEGELEIPYIFTEQYGDSLGSVLHISLGDEKFCTFQYCSVQKKIYGLKGFIRKYYLESNDVFLFTYLGESKFALSIYDSQCMDCLRDNDGYLWLDDFPNSPSESCFIDLTNISSSSTSDLLYTSFSEDDDKEVNSEAYVVPPLIELSDNEEDVIHDTYMPSWQIILKESHVSQRCHGVYMPRTLLSVYQSWGRRTTVTLRFRNREWDVEVLRNKRVCRFGIGWDNFTDGANLEAGQKLEFRYSGELTFEVRNIT